MNFNNDMKNIEVVEFEEMEDLEDLINLYLREYKIVDNIVMNRRIENSLQEGKIFIVEEDKALYKEMEKFDDLIDLVGDILQKHYIIYLINKKQLEDTSRIENIILDDYTDFKSDELIIQNIVINNKVYNYVCNSLVSEITTDTIENIFNNYNLDEHIDCISIEEITTEDTEGNIFVDNGEKIWSDEFLYLDNGYILVHQGNFYLLDTIIID